MAIRATLPPLSIPLIASGDMRERERERRREGKRERESERARERGRDERDAIIGHKCEHWPSLKTVPRPSLPFFASREIRERGSERERERDRERQKREMMEVMTIPVTLPPPSLHCLQVER